MAADLNFDYSSEIDQLKSRFDALSERELRLDDEISDIVRRNQDLPKQLNIILSRVKTRLAVAESDTSQLNSLLELTSVLAENVSVKVRELDLCKSRVVDCLQRVEDALDLRFCTEGIRASMENEDYEQAAGHVHRFLTLDSSVLGLGSVPVTENPTNQTPEENSSTISADDGESMEQQFKVMKEAENELKRIVALKFDEALTDGDVASMERFFKLFPLLNQHETGLKKFGNYLKTKIRETARKNYEVMIAGGQDQNRASVLYADTLTLLLEGVARVLEVHQPLIETYYGSENLLVLAEILQEACDEEAIKILDQFIKARQYNAKSKLIDTYNRQQSKYAQLEKLDPSELDLLLSEVTLLQTRAELYFRFIRRRVLPNLQPSKDDSETVKAVKLEKSRRLEHLLRDCRLNCRMQELIGQYISMEEYYMRETMSKAVELSGKETAAFGQSVSLTSCLVDDVFFVIRKCVRRTLSSSNVDCVCAMINNACALLETDYLRLLQQRLKAGYRAPGSLAEAYTTAAAAYASVMQQGKVSVAGGDSAERAREEFLTALNNAEASAECVKALKDTLNAEVRQQCGGGSSSTKMTEQNSAKLESCLGQLLDVAEKFTSLAKQGVEQLVSTAAKPRIKSIAERFQDFTHTPTDAEFSEFEAGDPFIEQFVVGLDSLLNNYKNCLTEINYQTFFEMSADETAKQLEKVLLKCNFNRLGGLLFDKQLRELSAYYTTSGGWVIREKFSRLSQIASILNVDSVQEAKDFYQSSAITWRLSAAEIRKILSIRVDFSADEIRKLKL